FRNMVGIKQSYDQDVEIFSIKRKRYIDYMGTSQEVDTKLTAKSTPLLVRFVIGLGSVLLVALLITILGFIFAGRYVIGSGKAQTISRPVAGFTQISLEGQGALTIQQTGTDSLTIEADDNILPLLTSEVSNDRLTLGTKYNFPFHFMFPRTPITYRL